MSERPAGRFDAALWVGVTGHRLNKLSVGEIQRLRGEVDAVLARLRDALIGLPQTIGEASKPSRYGVVSSLADGADRLVASAALAHSAKLVAPLPFARDVYARDFATPQSRTEYFALLEAAAEVIELPGSYDTETSRRAAYSAAGTKMIERSDIVIAIWDGEQASGAGGTAEVVAEARKRGRPVLWLPTSADNLASAAPRLLLADRVVEGGAIEELVRIINALPLRHSASPR